jgi:hypothetical protein
MVDYPFPQAHTIKGLQVQMVDDAIKLGIGHAAINLNMGTIMRPEKTCTTITYLLEGIEFYFDRDYLLRFDQRVKALSDYNIVVYLILLNSPRWDGIAIYPELRRVLLHPDYQPEGYISAFNLSNEEGTLHFRAFVEVIVERYTRVDALYGRACGYIIGNEVDSQWMWCNAGEKTVDEYVREYENVVRVAFKAVRCKYSQACVYISLTHLWNTRMEENPLRFYKGRDVVEKFNDVCLQKSDFDWAIAYHPYPENLFLIPFWLDETAVDALDTPRITFKSIDILPRYMSQPHLLYHDESYPQGKTRHIILSEQGFHSSENEVSEKQIAAAYALAYWKIEHLPAIEAFILHAHVDNREEFGLNLGLWRRDKDSSLPNSPGTPKPIYEIFKDIDGPRHDEIMQKAQEEIGSEILGVI